MTWNWQKTDWPQFSWNKQALKELESRFLYQSGILLGTLKHIDDEQKQHLTINLISTEAMKTSEIEGEILNRDSVQSSIRRNFGLNPTHSKASPAEQGIADMMVDLYRNFDASLSHDILHDWHKMLTMGRQDLRDIGRYRTHEEPMKVVSSSLHEPKIYFEAPPSSTMAAEMERFMAWFNESSALPALTRCGLAHLYFVCIHPFEDGNGRIGRAIAEKALSQSLGQPSLLALSQTIQHKRKEYYRHLELNNKELVVTDWLTYFAETILDAQAVSQKLIEFLIAKTRLYDRLRGVLNPRQERAIERMFREGPSGFKGGLSADNYITITDTTRATATRDLKDLVEKGALKRTGELRHTRYWLNIRDEG
ncbi:Fic family protein [Cohaesibacter celericrescens]|uniref:DUF4172 domain-containing protein n=1 Tax=Cohaesibacter celericrescens TaxID=2067669 RepID=A0A2N5XXH2_9HYPH|nr:DUF4172 domain-containing protein [Cohaesibacter celericrescens]PLW79192.1 DUF4172 domain-containing protein [Cohaesibacter celericrescens]